MTTHKQMNDVADRMAKAIKKLTDGLAKDGVALDGFLDAIAIQEEWGRIRLKRQLEIYFSRRAGVVKDFAHEHNKKMQSEALNKHDVGGRSEQLCLACHQEPATRGIGDRKTVCSKCWNIAAS